jgi:hypothetical protein
VRHSTILFHSYEILILRGFHKIFPFEKFCVFLAGAVSACDPDNSSGSLCVILNITSVVSFGDDIPFLLLGDMNK